MITGLCIGIGIYIGIGIGIDIGLANKRQLASYRPSDQ